MLRPTPPRQAVSLVSWAQGRGHLRHRGSGKSAARTLEGDQDPLDTTWPDPSLHLDRGDGLELPTMARMIVENSLQLVPGHLASDQALANLDYLEGYSRRAIEM